MSQLTIDAPAIEHLEEHRVELRGYCYRMLGSAFDADDAVQETLMRAWQARDRFEGRSSVRSWLYRIATNVCLDSLRSRQRRALPMDLAGPVPATTVPSEELPAARWVEPMPDEGVVPAATDPAQRAVSRDSVRLAFIAALQHLPPRQRAVLILREVLCWQATEVAELLDTSVASINSALQRARATLGQRNLNDAQRAEPLAEADRALLGHYLTAFEAYDIPGLVALLHEDASISMPPLAMWLQGGRTCAIGTSASESAAAAPACCRRWPTGRRPSGSTGCRPRAGMSRGPCRWSRSQPVGSGTSTTSSTPPCLPASGCRLGSNPSPSTSSRPVSTSNPAKSALTFRSQSRPWWSAAISANRATASMTLRSAVPRRSQTIPCWEPASSCARAELHSRATSAGGSGPPGTTTRATGASMASPGSSGPPSWLTTVMTPRPPANHRGRTCPPSTKSSIEPEIGVEAPSL
jgi:RNA polymerase sigma-70 factor (ECF subfamily)